MVSINVYVLLLGRTKQDKTRFDRFHILQPIRSGQSILFSLLLFIIYCDPISI